MNNTRDNLNEMKRALAAIDNDTTKCTLLLVYHEERDPASGRLERSTVEINEVNIEPVRDAIILCIKHLSYTLAQDLRDEADKLDAQGAQ